ncbi:hypothetical protein D3C84_897130 [compost metagenome]
MEVGQSYVGTWGNSASASTVSRCGWAMKALNPVGELFNSFSDRELIFIEFE